MGEGRPVPPGDRRRLTRVVILNGRRVDPARACIPIDDPAVRGGEGIFETMRARRGAVPFLDRHLDRLAASVAALGMAGMPPRDAIARDVHAAVAAAGDGLLRVRVTATPGPTLVVDAQEVRIDPATRRNGLRAVSCRGYWVPQNPLAEHKTLARIPFARAGRAADAAGADTALLLDPDGRLGEAVTANVFAVIDGALCTAPVRGLLPGVTRDAVLAAEPVREVALEEADWRRAAEMFLTSGIQGAVPVVEVDGAPVGDGRPGPVTLRVAAALDALLDGCR
ncbi:MAG: aminotransferase class IV [Actinomycetota bacterium]